jgi:hypothetical protein
MYGRSASSSKCYNGRRLLDHVCTLTPQWPHSRHKEVTLRHVRNACRLAVILSSSTHALGLRQLPVSESLLPADVIRSTYTYQHSGTSRPLITSHRSLLVKLMPTPTRAGRLRPSKECIDVDCFSCPPSASGSIAQQALSPEISRVGACRTRSALSNQRWPTLSFEHHLNLVIAGGR